MGRFATPEDVRSSSTITAVRQMDSDDLDDLYIIPAQDEIADTFCLVLNSDGYPENWSGTFSVRPDYARRYLDDYRRAVIILVDHWAENPMDHEEEVVAGASVRFRGRMPRRVRSLMRKWGKGGSRVGRIYRT